MQHGLKVGYLIIRALSIEKYKYVHKCNTLKEMRDIFEMIYEDSNKIKREIMKKLDQELKIPKNYEENLQNYFSNIKTLVLKV